MPEKNLQFYGFGTIERWRKVATKALEEGIIDAVSEVKTTIGTRDGVSETRLRAYVLGQTGVNWYRVEIRRTAESLNCACACPAGERGIPCKHCAAVLITQQWMKPPKEAVYRPRQDTFPEYWDPEHETLVAAIQSEQADG